ncbi:hypothetical protein CHS0354_021407 [Potamilus streckersoni]|uniref:SRCR domain-containing protein n=1 Tax=Potamilus streckersoni TaxID=2493646 RepID=A0AAE0VNT0_9BIVA|nr:hypothetical protein CHS0354_021407 [Potamilus streckersoni]
MNSHMIVVGIGILGFLTLSRAQSEGDIRLTDAQIPTRGKIEIFHSGSWGRVCDDGFADSSATVACRQLFGAGVTGQAIQSYDYYYYNYLYHDVATIWLDDVMCAGNEARLMDCPHLPWGQHNCVNYEDVGVNCFGVVFPTTNSTPPIQELKFQAVVNDITGYGFLDATTAKSIVSCVRQCVQCCDAGQCDMVQYEETTKTCTFMKYDQSLTGVTVCSNYSMNCMKRL